MPFVKGDENINRNGRPKGSVSIVAAIKKKLEEEHPSSSREEKRLWLDMIVTKIFDVGLEGNPQILKDMIDRIDGKPQEKVDVTSMGDKITPIYGGKDTIQGYDSDREDIQTEEED